MSASVRMPIRPPRSSALVHPVVLQRRCACGGIVGPDVECAACRAKRQAAERGAAGVAGQAVAPPIVQEVLRSGSGRPLEAGTRARLEPRFGHDFGRVRIHTDARAAESARAVGAMAYTVGQDIVFGAGQYAPRTPAGAWLLAHELAHATQQAPHGTADLDRDPIPLADPDAGHLERSADQAADAGVGPGPVRARVPAADLRAPVLQRQTFGQPFSIGVRSPAFEEAVTQLSEVSAAAAGRPLLPAERSLAEGVFGTSVAYARVRLIPTRILEYRTVGNTIRVPEDFTIAQPYMAETFIHEMTHVWQYQHGGTSYISASLSAQIVGTIAAGSRNAAYDYVPNRRSFFEFTPEQQGLIVQNYFAMQRDRTRPATAGPFRSNHLDSSGNFQLLSWADRQAEIAREFPIHQTYVQQMRAAQPEPEANLLLMRAADVMREPGGLAVPVAPERQIAPVKPLLEITF